MKTHSSHESPFDAHAIYTRGLPYRLLHMVELFYRPDALLAQPCLRSNGSVQYNKSHWEKLYTCTQCGKRFVNRC